MWFYDVDADSWSLDDKRTPLLPEDKLGPTPRTVLDPGVRRGDEDGQGHVRHSGGGRNPVLTPDEHAKNNLPDILSRWRTLHSLPRPLAGEGEGKTYVIELDRPRTAQSFCVPKADIAAQGYDLSLNRYKEVVHEEVAHRPPGEILQSLANLEAEIQQGFKELEGMLR